ncbi:acyl carrier protein [Streptomyces sp. DH12]|uniref:acyl carrier protein n=1 Tax=Streptomyces sp. DH12 TaxID=2857010 RepID=UPI001E43826B|nr:acyl carrier protein [Streptomyces sp. DH12]
MPPHPHDAVADALADLTGTPADRLTPDTPLTDLGLDSLLVEELLTVLAAKHGITPAHDADLALGPHATVGDVLALVDTDRAAGGVRSSGALL